MQWVLSTNVRGVCGFTSALYAFYENNPTLRDELANAAKTSTRVIAEIKSFLVQLQADGDSTMLEAIETFTQSFEGYSGFTISDYIKRINAVAAKGSRDAEDDFSIALPPDAVVAYLRYIGLSNARILPSNTTLSSKNELVLCLSDPTGKLKLYNGLCHYVYQKESTIYSWGRQFDSIEEAGKVIPETTGWSRCVIISPHG